MTVSLLPDFRNGYDYRYFPFAFLHYVMVVDLFSESERRFRLLFTLLGILPAFLVIRGILYEPAVFDMNQMNRLGYPLDHPNTAGYLLSMAVPLAIGVIVREKAWLRGIGLFSLGAQLLGLILTYSREAWLGSAVSLLSLGLLERKLRTFVLILGLVGFVVGVAAEPFRNRLTSLLDPMEDPTIVWRVRVMINVVALVQESPLVGVGYGRDRLREALTQNRPEARQLGFIAHSHNMYVGLLSGTGILGLGSFLWLLFSALIGLLRKAQREEVSRSGFTSICLAASLIAFMVTGLGDVPFYHHETRIFFFTLLALIQLHLAENPHAVGKRRD